MWPGADAEDVRETAGQVRGSDPGSREIFEGLDPSHILHLFMQEVLEAVSRRYSRFLEQFESSRSSSRELRISKRTSRSRRSQQSRSGSRG